MWPFTVITESFKGLPSGFYFVILPLGIRWALRKYHIKTLGTTKNKVFVKTFMDRIFFYICSLEITWGLQQYDSELKKTCYLPTPQLTLGHSQGGSLTNPMLITALELFWPECHRDSLSEVGSLCPAEQLVGLEPGNFRF